VEINNIKLLGKDEILRRLARMTGEPYLRRPTEITKLDLAKWVGVDVRRIRLHTSLTEDISDSWQLIYSQFFALVDSGELVVKLEKNRNGVMTKVLVRGPKPAKPPRKPLMPRIDMATIRLKLD
jgi:hypothetical protein